MGEGGAPRRFEFELGSELFQAGENVLRLVNTGRGEMNVVYLLLR